MSFKRSFIAFIMLLTYTLSFAHDIIPHFHTDSDFINGVVIAHQEHDRGHEHISIDDSNQSQSVQHIDHADKGLIDFVICLLESVEHGVTGDQQLLCSSQDQFQENQSFSQKSQLSGENQFQFFEITQSIESDIATIYFREQFIPIVVFLDCNILRGPPAFPC